MKSIWLRLSPGTEMTDDDILDKLRDPLRMDKTHLAEPAAREIEALRAALQRFIDWEDGNIETSPAQHFNDAVKAARAVLAA